MQVKIIVQNSRDVFPAKKNGVLYFSSNFTIKKKKKVKMLSGTVHITLPTINIL